jgi:etoposide-induced 2.4 mRNA
MAMHARPVPLDPYNPLPPTSTASTNYSTTQSAEETIHHPSPLIPIRLPIFALVIWLNDWIVRAISVGGGSGGRARSGARSVGRTRATSDGFEKVEEGIDLGAFGGRSFTDGIGRRKAD